METALKFRPRSRIIRTIGDRLVSGPIAALLELVKNSHDADAKWVRITFIPPLEQGKGQIIVEDDGHGMTVGDIENQWMEPATNDKENRRFSPAGRPLLGAKGIGRFAAARLGESMTLRTTALSPTPQAPQTTRIPNLSWHIFDDIEYLEDIRIPYEVTDNSAEATGTRLEIDSLRDTWNKPLLRKLCNDLRRLVSPLEEKEANDFRIYLDLSKVTKESSGFDGDELVRGSFPQDGQEPDRIYPFQLLKASDYEIEGDFSRDGKFTGSMFIHRTKGAETIPINFSVPLKESEGERPCGQILLQLYIFDREPDAINAMIERANLQGYTKTEARNLLDDMIGIAIYRDRFRIKPYGNSDNDWLELDKRRVQTPTMRIGQNQIMGLIVIEDEKDSNLVERSSREGLEENGSYYRLKALLHSLLTHVEPHRQKFRKKAGLGRPSLPNVFQKPLKAAELNKIKEVIKYVPEEKRESARRIVVQESDALKQHFNRIQEQQARLEARSTLGLIVAEILHEARPPVSYLHDQSKRIQGWLATLCEQSSEAVERKEQHFPRILREMHENSQKLNRLFSLLDPLAGRRRGNPEVYSIKEAIHHVVEIFESKIKSLNIKTPIMVDDTDLVKAYKADTTAVLTNLMDNALYWLSHEKPPNPEIRFSVTSDQKEVIIDISNNGPNIPEEFIEQIFDVGFTLKPDGTGLGLAISREAIARSSGTLTFKHFSPGVNFRIRLPRGQISP